MTPDNTQSYFLQRMHQLGITEQINTVETPIFNAGVPGDIMHAHKIFEEDKEGNIKINYLMLTGAQYSWRKEGNKWPIPYQRTRLKVPREVISADGKKDNMKYSQPKGSGQFPFFPANIIYKYIEAIKEPDADKRPVIDTLIIVEGEFKAQKGSMVGLDIIGIPSIHGFYDGDGDGSLHPDIQELLTVLRVKRIVYLTDADTLSVTWEEGKDLRKRITSFNSAVKNFRNSLQLFIDAADIALDLVYFMHLKTKYIDDAKGLDDLLCKHHKKTEKIVEDLLKFDLAKDYFTGKNITDNRYSQTLFNYFGLNSVERFYQVYKEFIGNREFRWGKSRYQWDGEEVSHVRHEDADKYFRVGADWMKVIHVPNKFGDLEEDLIPFKISEITRDYKHYPDFIDQLPRFDAFVNVPDWNGTYRRKIYDCYNICNPINYKPKAGSIAYTIEYLKHVFQGEGMIKESFDIENKEPMYMECANLGDPFTVILDYLTLQYQQPTHRLPVPILVSPEQGTGKSTFLKWLRMIYGSNATILDNDRFKMNFNAHFITKYIIGLDEGFLDIEKKAEKEKLKQMATADEAFLENKGMNIKRFPYYGKLIICSNDADKVMQMDPEDRRWFVVRVPKLNKKDPELEEKLMKEIPAWLYFLERRKMAHPKEDDLWFRTEYIITEQFTKIVQTTKSRIDKVVENFLKDMFLTYRLPVLRLDMKTLLEALNDPKTSKYKIDEKDLEYYLEEKKHMQRERVQRVQIPVAIDVEKGNTVVTVSKAVRPFVFRYEGWLNEAEVVEFHSAADLVKIDDDTPTTGTLFQNLIPNNEPPF